MVVCFGPGRSVEIPWPVPVLDGSDEESDEESDDDGNENSYIEEILIKESYDDQMCDKDSYESNTQEAESNCEEESFGDNISPHFRQNECEPSSWEEYIT